MTHGGLSVVIADSAGSTEVAVPPRTVVDVTGAGDALIAGVIMARLDGLAWSDAAAAGVEVAGRKVEVVGHLPEPLDRRSVYGTVVS